MTTYPEIDRRDGRLFFTVGEHDRVAIATSIERLIDLLDALEGDPDLEPDDDDEPCLGAPEQVQQGFWYSWTLPDTDERECDNADDEPYLSGWFRDTSDLEADPSDLEPALGWQNEGTQARLHFPFGEGEDEPELGWFGHATGYQPGEGYEEGDPAEHGICDFAEDTFTVPLDGSGVDIAIAMLRGIPTREQRMGVMLALGGRPKGEAA